MNHPEKEKNAGGMTYRTLPGIETTLITQYLDRHDKKPLYIVSEKNKKYYMASADKTIARLELAKIRVENSDISWDEYQVVMERISHGLDCMERIKNRVKNVASNGELHKLTPYKLWHAVKLIPSAAEGYAVTASIENALFRDKRPESNPDLEKIKTHLDNAKTIFSHLLNLDESTDFTAAEKSRLKAYKEIKIVQMMQND